MAYSSYLLPNSWGGSPTSNPPLRGFGGGYNTGGTTYPVGGGGAPMIPMSAGSPSSFPGGNVSANSVGTGVGSIAPDMSGVPLAQQRQWQNNLGRLTYDLDSGGYRFNDVHYTGNLGAWHRSDPAANLLASQTYSQIGNVPTRTYGSLALERLYQLSGYKPKQLPSMNQRFSDAGLPTYQGPATFPGYDPFRQYR